MLGEAPGLRLARLRTRALDGTRRDLPQDLPAERTLVLLAYRQRHQRDVDAWIALAVANGRLEEVDGPMLSHGLQGFHGQKRMITPNRAAEEPGAESLGLRWESFVAG